MTGEELFEHIPDTCEDNLSEMVTSLLLAGADALVTADLRHSNNNNNSVLDTNQYSQEASKAKAENAKSEECAIKYSAVAEDCRVHCKRGRPCAQPPTREVLRRRRKVFL